MNSTSGKQKPVRFFFCNEQDCIRWQQPYWVTHLHETKISRLTAKWAVRQSLRINPEHIIHRLLHSFSLYVEFVIFSLQGLQYWNCKASLRNIRMLLQYLYFSTYKNVPGSYTLMFVMLKACWVNISATWISHSSTNIWTAFSGFTSTAASTAFIFYFLIESSPLSVKTL